MESDPVREALIEEIAHVRFVRKEGEEGIVGAAAAIVDALGLVQQKRRIEALEKALREIADDGRRAASIRPRVSEELLHWDALRHIHNKATKALEGSDG
jgi:hypothetical protein